MSQTYTDLIVHVVFSTKGRKEGIHDALKTRLWAYLAGIVRELGGKPIIVNGTSNHVHLLIQWPPTLSIADALRVIKTNSSRWINGTKSEDYAFGWQSGYGAFSLDRADVGTVSRYISGQEDHHRRLSFQNEPLELLKEHAIEFDELLLWK